MAAKDDSSDLLVLRRKPRFTGWLGLGWRFAAMFFLLGLLVLIHWIERDGLKDNYDGSVSFLDVIYFTMISATTTGYGDIVPVADRTRLRSGFCFSSFSPARPMPSSPGVPGKGSL